MMKCALAVPLLLFCGVTSDVLAQSPSHVICNPKSQFTNIRSGPTAKDTQIVDKLANNVAIKILDRVKNPEGTHDWLKVEFKHSQSGAATTGFIYHEGVSAQCEENSSMPVKSVSVKQEPTSPSSPASGNGAFNISRDPMGSGECQGYIIPYSLLNRRGVLNIDISRAQVDRVLCQDNLMSVVVNTAETYTTPRQGTQVCQLQIRFYGERGAAPYFFEGKVQVGSQSNMFCSKPTNIVNGENVDRSLVRLAFFHKSNIYNDENAYTNVIRAEKEAINRKIESDRQAENENFIAQLKAQDGAQGLYLFAGGLERQNNEARARQAYDYIIANHPSSEWSVKANDRLLAMKGEATSRQRANALQDEINTSRSQTKEMCEKRWAACYSSCTLNNSSGYDRSRCQSGCPRC